MSASDRAVKKERPKNHFGFAPVPAFAMNDFNDHGTQFPRGALRLGYHVGEPVDLSIEERRLHLYIAGKTGTGKTTLMANLAVQDLQAGRGFALLDPHGDMAERLLHYVPRRHTNSTVYLNPNDRSVAVGINVLEDVPPDYRPLVAAGVVAAMKHIWRDSWGARLAHFLLNTVLALMDTPGSTLLGVPLMLLDGEYRRDIVARVTNPVVRQFFEVELPSYPQNYTREAMGPVLNKIQSFLVFPAVRNIIGQPRSTIDLRTMMDEGKFLIANLSKGLIGEEPASLLGSLIITKLELAAMGRADMLEFARRDFAIYADEFHSFATSSFATLLSEARKYRVSLVGAHQYLDQLPIEVRKAVFGNIGTMIVFRVGGEDGRVFQEEMMPLALDEITELPAFRAWIKLPGGEPRFEIATDDLRPPSGLRAAKVKEQSKRRHTRPTRKVETEIAQFINHAAR
jgi:hypothetical protein